MAMWAHEHPTIEISDYILDLLSPVERERLERHFARCADCRLALSQERALIRDVRQTVLAASRPSPARLRQLMSPPPTEQRRKRFEVVLRPVLVFSILLVLFAASLHQYAPNVHGVVPPTATTLAATATTTPTSTVSSDSDRAVVGGDDEQLVFELAGTPVAGIYTDAHHRDS